MFLLIGRLLCSTFYYVKKNYGGGFNCEGEGENGGFGRKEDFCC
jgi:hypothetical protein